MMRVASALVFFVLFNQTSLVDAGEVWFAGGSSNSIGLFDEETLALIDEIPIDQTADDVDFSSDGDTAFVVSTAHSLLVIDADLREVTNGIDIGALGDLQIERRPESEKLYIGNCFSTPQLLIIDAVTNTAVDLDPLTLGLQGIAIPGGGTPWKMDFSPDGQFVYTTKCGGPFGGQIFKIDLDQNVVDTAISVTPAIANSVAVSDDGMLAIVAGSGDETSIIDLTTDTEVGLYEFGSGTNDGVAVYKERNRAFSLNFDFFAGELHLLELDITDPTGPVLMSQLLLNDPLKPGSTRGLSLRRIGDSLFATLGQVGGTSDSQVVLIDISTELPSIQTRTNFGSFAFSQVIGRPAILSPAEQVAELRSAIFEINRDPGVSNSLGQRLEAASRLLSDENSRNDVAAVRTLESLIHSLEAQRGRRLTAAQADELIDSAENAIGAILGE